MAEIETTEARQSIVTPLVRWEFQKLGDRWCHLLTRRDVPAIALLKSVEDITPRDPTRVLSPTYQELSVQAGPDLVQALLVGQSGKHHFSAVFTVRENDREVVIDVDVADRCREPVAAFGCTYFVDAISSDLASATPSRIVWEKPLDIRERLSIEAEGPTRLTLAEAGRAATQVQVSALIQPDHATHRCVYRWRFVLNPDLER